MSERKMDLDFSENTMNHSGISITPTDTVYNVTVSPEEVDTLIKDAGTIIINIPEESEKKTNE